ncbi:hypothetical protein GGX14DRAFT_607194 [Mycena pura]|uniref:F-box domain-containing protein n=1 Tax=Mycena pura TaxID=153505 RepID=A0AAD6YJN5_9AGAR|nr:hypothetical protein GGX14DRAFT_607194 [Mycena pura]
MTHACHESECPHCTGQRAAQHYLVTCRLHFLTGTITISGTQVAPRTISLLFPAQTFCAYPWNDMHTALGIIELLQRIFLYSLPPDKNAKPSLRRAPLNLTHVSAKWRVVALATPELWRNLCLEFPAFSGYAAVLIDEWLARGRDRPLGLALRCTDNSVTDHLFPASTLPSDIPLVLARYLPSCSKLELDMRAHDLSLCYRAIMGRLPNLETIKIKFSDARKLVVDDIPAIPVSLAAATTLRTVIIPDMPRAAAADALDFVPPSTVTLELGVIEPETTFAQLKPVFERCPCLLHLTFNNNFGGSDFGDITCSQLQSLAIRGQAGVELLNQFTLPGLKNLSVIVWYNIYVPSFTSFVTRSTLGFNLRRLTLYTECFSGSSQALTDILIAVPGLTCFWFFAWGPDTDLSREWYAVLARPELVPSLRDLRITEHALQMPTALFHRVLEARPGLQVAELQVKTPAAYALDEQRPEDTLPPEIAAERFDYLSKGGMHVRLKSAVGIQSWPNDVEWDTEGIFCTSTCPKACRRAAVLILECLDDA